MYDVLYVTRTGKWSTCVKVHTLVNLQEPQHILLPELIGIAGRSLPTQKFMLSMAHTYFLCVAVFWAGFPADFSTTLGNLIIAKTVYNNGDAAGYLRSHDDYHDDSDHMQLVFPRGTPRWRVHAVSDVTHYRHPKANAQMVEATD